jgi:hypothetical protein
MEDNKKLPEIPQKLFCIKCNYLCSHKGDWNKHIRTSKHLNGNNDNKHIPKTPKTPQTYKCLCGNEYNHQSGLSRHRKKCKIEETVIEENYQTNDIHEIKEIMKYLMKENSEMKNMMLEQQNMMIVQNTSTQHMMMDVIKTGTNNTTHTNSHNKTFNLNFYLNETCKEALNITDFVSSIKVSLSDLENTGRQGYIEGISSIILKHLNNLEQYQRPIHCSDVKREVIYIKDNDKWEKECEEKPLLTKAIKVIANENIKKISEWRENNPDCTNSESKKNNLYLKIVSNSMNGSDKEEGQKNITKIISNLAKETIIQKEN